MSSAGCVLAVTCILAGCCGDVLAWAPHPPGEPQGCCNSPASWLLASLQEDPMYLALASSGRVAGSHSCTSMLL